MIHIVLGTKAQLIKMAPIMKRLRDRGIAYNYISTGQHRDTVEEIHQNFGIKGPDMVLYDGKDITKVPQMLVWAARILWQVLLKRGEIFGHDRQGIVLVHGDTFSTLLGALMGKILGLKVGHVESGLRSFNLWQPFPEEITRLLTFVLSDVYFCPGSWALENLQRFRGEKVNTQQNTMVDAMREALKTKRAPSQTDTAPEAYCIATIHRYENIFQHDSLQRIVDTIELIAKSHRVRFILHKPTQQNLIKFGMLERLRENPHIELLPRLGYFAFMNLLQDAQFVISDGGSNQEECSYLGIPVLLLRDVTERKEGLGENIVISHYNKAIITDFIANIAKYRKAPSIDSLGSPTEIIVEHCLKYVGKS